MSITRNAKWALAAWVMAAGLGAQAQTSVVATPNAPQAIGPYSQAIKAGNVVYVSGTLAIDPKTNEFKKDGSIEEQTTLVLDNIKAILAAEGLTMEHVVSTTVFMHDLNEFGKMNETYAKFFTSKPPARATVQVSRLPRDAKLEISAIAVKP